MTPIVKGDRLNAGDKLRPGEALLSPNKWYLLTLQADDGNLVLYHLPTNDGKRLDDRSQPIWASGTNKDRNDAAFTRDLDMQAPDGHLVLYGKNGSATSVSRTWGGDQANSYAALQNDGNLVVYRPNGHSSWQTGSGWHTHWMEALPGHLTLLDICVPGSHDAGMYYTKNFASGTALAQELDLYKQLRAGSRYFDLRPRYNEGKGYYVYHGPADGPRLEQVLAGVKRFFDEGSAETVVLRVSAWKDFEQNPDRQREGLQFIVDHLPQQALLVVPRSKSLLTLPLSQLRGKLLVVVENNNYHPEGTGNSIYQDIVLADERAGRNTWPGVYSVNHEAHVFNQYSDKRDYQEMVDHQAEKFRDFGTADEQFMLNWTLTPHSVTFLVRSSVKGYSEEINPKLLDDVRGNKQGLFGRNGHGKMVNIINLDYVETANAVPACLDVMRRVHPTLTF